MKTVVHLPHVPLPRSLTAGPRRQRHPRPARRTVVAVPRRSADVRRSTIHLGIAVSALAAAIAVVLRSLTDVPSSVVIGGVVVAGSLLSWRQAGPRSRLG